MKPRLQDVAERAGVSRATVSRVLNDSQQVDPDLAERVRVAAEQLGYRANLLARGLRRQRSDIVGLVVPQVGNPFFAALMQAASRHLQTNARTVLLADAEDDTTLEARVMTRLADHGIDGMLLAPVSELGSGAAARAVRERVPVVFLDRAAHGVNADVARVDQRAGIDLILAHLADELGPAPATRFVSAAPLDSAARARVEAYRRAVGDGRVRDPHPALLGSFTVTWGREAAARLLADAPLPRAVVCGNDLIALGVVATLTDRGVSVPRDVVVTGFDDVGFAQLSTPTLTTVRQPLDELVAKATELLEARIAGEQRPAREEVLPPTLVVRDSTRRRRT